jgi:hypothetical protein
MWPKERLRALRILSVMAFLVVCAWLLNGCATLPYAPPYPEYVLEKADPWIKQITYLPDAELQKACNKDFRVDGCADLLTGEIFASADPEIAECVILHEKSHFYEVYVMGVPVDETQSHKHWHKPYCYRPLRASGSIGLTATLP